MHVRFRIERFFLHCFLLGAQEEVLLYNSDAYRSLLDLKYGRMQGGYAIPEFGLAYVRNIRIFKSPSCDDSRKADMLVSACYCMTGHELYPNPRNIEDVSVHASSTGSSM